MRHLFSLFPGPSRYIGIEEGSVHKDKASLSLHIGLAFPDLYEVGMSYFGHKILADIVNANDTWWAERVFAPCREAGELLQKHQTLLATLESDTALAELDVLGFSITHELCFSNVLYMLDLGGIPLRATSRAAQPEKQWPWIIAGGGCTLAAEPLAPFVDMMVLGEGEAVFPALLHCLEEHRGKDRDAVLLAASRIPGVYVPEFFSVSDEGRLVPRFAEYTSVQRQIIPHMDDAAYPKTQAIPFGAVHSRLTLEIARGCTRGCRFCQAGINYRPSRERSIANITTLLDSCLRETGFDDVSFLSLSTGDFSALRTLFFATIDRCAQEQVSVSLPSLRVGSIDDSIMERLAAIRRTGATLAPEAGSQRLRDVINKGITEDELVLHIQKLYEHGWRQVKLYFMLGLPTETDEDVLAILDLCIKARDAAGPGVRDLQITAALSPFVPKPHTPFQWEEQDSLEDIKRKVGLLLSNVKGHKRIKLRWHDPEVSFLEGIFSRGDRRLADVVERAYHKGAIFPSWLEHFALEPWLEALEECGVSITEYTGARHVGEALAWDHLESGVSQEFLVRERSRALQEKCTSDCRYDTCHACGVCDRGQSVSLLHGTRERAAHISNVLNFPQRDQVAHEATKDASGRIVARASARAGKQQPPKLAVHLTRKVAQWRLWYSKQGNAVFISQLELQSIFDRALRKSAVPLAFSQGYHPLPLLSFGRALPIGVASEGEWLSLYLTEECSLAATVESLNRCLPRGLCIVHAEELSLTKENADATEEEFIISAARDTIRSEVFTKAWQQIAAAKTLPWARETKKGIRELDARGYFARIAVKEDGLVHLVCNWEQAGYISPLAVCMHALSAVGIPVSPADIYLQKKKELAGSVR